MRRKHSEETKEKIRQSLMGHAVSDKTRALIAAKSKGRQTCLGIPKSEETKRKISATLRRKGIQPILRFKASGSDSPAWKGGRPKCADCGKQLRAYGAKLCQWCNVQGERAPNWKGGLTEANKRIRNSKPYADWRIAVFKRDNFTCQECGATKVYLEADHIKPFAQYPELRFDVSNGRSLCDPCHKATPTYGAKLHSYKEQAA